MIFKYHVDGSVPSFNQVFVFGSNMSGIHGAGAAKFARVFCGAVMGVAEGPTGAAYAIPTVKEHIAGPLPLDQVQAAISRFLSYAKEAPDMEFFVTRIGCGLAGFTDQQIAPLFKKASTNCSMPHPWKEFLE